MAHCAGSLVLFASLLSGALEGKVRNVVASQVAANPMPCSFNKLKAGLHIPGVLESLGFEGLTVDRPLGPKGSSINLLKALIMCSCHTTKCVVILFVTGVSVIQCSR